MASIFKKLLVILKQPFPDTSNPADTLKTSFRIGAFIFLFLLIFQPFGLATSGSKIWLYAFVFGLITFSVTLVFDLLMFYVIRIDRSIANWTFGKWLIEVLILIFLIGCANYVFVVYYFNFSHNWINFLTSIFSALLLGIFPIFLGGAIHLNKQNQKNSKIAKSIHTHQHHSDINISIEHINSMHILYIESMQNYLRIWYIEDEKVESKIIRNTLKNIQKILEETDILRCHRSFLVNTNYIKRVEGNAQGLKLFLDHLENEYVPVSRNYIHLFDRD